MHVVSWRDGCTFFDKVFVIEQVASLITDVVKG
jgi:hypothetical protein